MYSAATCDAGLQLGTFPRKYYNRWIVLMFYLIAEAFIGLPFSMGLLTEALKVNLGLSQVNVDLVASCGLLASCQGFFIGLLLGVKSNNHKCFLLVAAFLISGGLLYMGMALKSQIPVNVGFMCVIWFFANLGTCIFTTSSYAVNVINFPQKDRGKVCGLAKGTFGMSSAVLAQLYSSFFSDRGTYPEAMFTLSLSIIVFSVVCLSAIFTNITCPSHIDYVPEHAQGIVPSFRLILSWNYGVLAILIALTSCELAGISIASIATGIIVFVFILCGYAIPYIYGSAMVSTLGPENKLMPATAPVSEQPSPQISSEDCECDKVEEDSNCGASISDAQPLLELSWYKVLLDRRFWAVFICFSVSASSGLTLMNNVTYIAISLGLEPLPAFVALMGLGNAISRLLTGVFADILHRHGLPHSFIFFISLGAAAGNNFLLSIGSTGYLDVGLLIGTVCFGSLSSTTLGLMADYFGPKHIGVNYGMLDVGPALSFFALSTGLVSVFYKADESGYCIGRECFQNTFIIIGCLCAVCLPIVFFILLKPDYAQLQIKILTKSTNDVGKGENGETSIEVNPSEITFATNDSLIDAPGTYSTDIFLSNDFVDEGFLRRS